MIEKKKLVFIVNPISGDIKKTNFSALVERYIDDSKFDWEIKYTLRAGHATHRAREAVANKAAIVVAVGGDGSINEVATALVNTQSALAVIPLGSGNGLAYHLHLPVKNIKKSIQLINDAKTLKIDTLSSTNGLIIAFAGFGFEAIVARTYRHIGKRGFLAYAWATIRGVFVDYKAIQLDFEIDGKHKNEKIYTLSIYNAKYLGYKVGKVAEASLQDGKMNLVLIKAFPFWKTLWIVLLELIGKIHWSSDAEIYKAKHVRIHLKPKSQLQLDGDSFVSSQVFEITVNPLSLNILVPKHLEKL